MVKVSTSHCLMKSKAVFVLRHWIWKFRKLFRNQTPINFTRNHDAFREYYKNIRNKYLKKKKHILTILKPIYAISRINLNMYIRNSAHEQTYGRWKTRKKNVTGRILPEMNDNKGESSLIELVVDEMTRRYSYTYYFQQLVVTLHTIFN